MADWDLTYVLRPERLTWTSLGICGSDIHWYVDGRIGDTVVEQPMVRMHYELHYFALMHHHYCHM